MKGRERRIRERFNRACTRFRLLEDGDKILVGLSGGKDSLMLLQLLAERARVFRPSIRVAAVHVVMDNIPYETDLDYLHAFCQELGVALSVVHRSFDESTDRRKTKCFLCSWHRRKALFEFAREKGFNKIALGHHNDDFMTTLLMNMTYEGSVQTMKPALTLEHYPITIVRPLCLVHEADLREAAENLGYRKQKASCPYEDLSRRESMSRIFHQIEDINPEARYSLWHAIMKQS